MNNKENQEKTGLFSSENLSYAKTSEDLPTTYFKPIDQVQQAQKELIKNYQQEKKENLIDIPDLSAEVRKLEEELKRKKNYMSLLSVVLLVLFLNVCWFLGVKFLIEPKYEQYVEESKEIKANYDSLKRRVDAIVGSE